MKKIHKKIIFLQARAIDKALKSINFKKYRERSARRPGYIKKFKGVISTCHIAFSDSIQVLKGSSDAFKAKVVRDLFKQSVYHGTHNSRDNYRRRCDRNSRIKDFACHYSFKSHIVYHVLGIPSDSTEITPKVIIAVSAWVKAGKNGKFKLPDSRWEFSNQKDQGGFKSDETVMLGSLVVENNRTL